MNLGRCYRTVRQVKRHGAVAVYDVWSEERACRCVAKVALATAGAARARRRIRAEAKLLLSLGHPHLVRAYELLERPRVALILEPLPGETLDHALARRGRLSPRDAAALGLHLASALSYLHGRGILHLDVKPGNVVCHAGLARLIDLGIARRPGSARSVAGTPGYSAPEQAGAGRRTAAADVFGLGAVLYEAASGVAPFRPPVRGRPGEWVWRGPLSRFAVPPGLSALVDACLDPHPARRPGLAEVQRALRAVAAGDGARVRARGARRGPARGRGKRKGSGFRPSPRSPHGR